MMTVLQARPQFCAIQQFLGISSIDNPFCTALAERQFDSINIRYFRKLLTYNKKERMKHKEKRMAYLFFANLHETKLVLPHGLCFMSSWKHQVSHI